MEENAIVSVHPRQQIRSTGRHLLHYINSGPMSEGHVRLCNNDQRASDPSQNLCLFTPCLFAVGLSIFSVGECITHTRATTRCASLTDLFGTCQEC